MMVHIYRHGEDDRDGIHRDTARVTIQAGERYGVDGSALILGTKPNITVIGMSEIRWLWIEEN